MKHCLNDRFSISKDKYNFILIDKKNGKKESRHYFTNVKQLSNFIGELKLRECLDRCEVSLCNKSSLTPSYSSVIEEIIGELELYIDSITKKSESIVRKD
jgi:hypothetical protein